MDWSTTTAAARRGALRTALNVYVTTLRNPVSTAEVVDAIAQSLKVPSRDRQKLARDILALAPEYPQAQRSSAGFKRYGRDMRPWVWSPVGIARSMAEAGALVADDAASEDWTAEREPCKRCGKHPQCGNAAGWCKACTAEQVARDLQR